MSWWQAALLGLVEGVTEFLPVSSTGHLILVTALLGLDGAHTKQAMDDLNVIVQGGAVLAVLLLYRGRAADVARGLVGQSATGRRLLVNLSVAFLPAAAAGLLLGDAIAAHLFAVGPVLLALAAGGVAMLVADRFVRRATPPLSIDAMTIRHAAIIGLLQCAALWPGTSRSMATILGGVLVGLGAAEAAQFSFLLGVLTLGAASSYRLFQNLGAPGPSLFEQLGVAPALVAMTVAALAAALSVKWLVAFLARRGFAPFGWYRLALAAALWGLAATGLVRLSAG